MLPFVAREVGGGRIVVARVVGEKGTRWGIPLSQWADARELARAAMLARARARETITYAELAQAVSDTGFKPRSWALMALLGEVCRDEDPVHDVWTASLVVRKDTGMPGDGYFGYAEREGFDVSDRSAFWREHVQRVWNAYSD
jgi:hypothetical protein